ncbi:MAG: cbb3-type cytochrome c oxidase N-terminal domain-containing protein [Planctomycetota bacterium]
MSAFIEEVQATSQNETSVNQDLLTSHSYDGIQEYDNPLPGWWVFLFWFFIVIGPVYYFYFHCGTEGRSIHDQYNDHMASIYELKFSEIGELTADRDTILKYMNEKEWLAVGEVIYKTNCTSCHGGNGEGIVGPNLTDDYWKHISSVEGIAKIIEEGAANGAMPAWKNRLTHPNQIVLTAAYIASLRKNPVDGKPPEGKLIPAWDN